MTIGDRIKNLRKKTNMTQEDLANCLGVSYQAVSKWECNLTSPDLGLIGPLTKLLGVTADELLGLTEEENDERKAYFDSEYKGFWKRNDLQANYEIAKQAVEEYPGNFKYLGWLANMEYYMAFDDDYRNGVPYDQLTYFNEMIDKSIRHSLIVYENSKDEELRNSALWLLILSYKFSNRPDEARHYAELYPEKSSTTRDDAMLLVLTGEERVKLRQKMLIDVGRIKERLALADLDLLPVDEHGRLPFGKVHQGKIDPLPLDAVVAIRERLHAATVQPQFALDDALRRIGLSHIVLLLTVKYKGLQYYAYIITYKTRKNNFVLRFNKKVHCVWQNRPVKWN